MVCLRAGDVQRTQLAVSDAVYGQAQAESDVSGMMEDTQSSKSRELLFIGVYHER